MLSSQVAWLLDISAVLPLTTAVLPTNCRAWLDCAVCCSETSVESESLVLICCWTPANSTSCWVNWLVSSGLSGFWFCNCVVSSCRKLWKLPAICVLASALAAAAELPDEFVGNVVVPETTGLDVVAAVVVISLSLHPDIHAAARRKRAAVSSSRNRRLDGVFIADDQPLGVGIVALVVVLAGRRLVAQAELQTAASGLEPGIVERLLQLRRI